MNWSLVRQGMLEDQLAQMSEWPGTSFGAETFSNLFGGLSQSIEDLDPSFRRGLDDAAQRQNLPQALVAYGEAAGRVEFDGVWFATREDIASWYLENHQDHIKN